MLQVIQYQKTGEMFVEELPEPSLKKGMVLVRNVCSLISAGTERSSVETAQASMIGKARSRPDLVRQVLDNVKREGIVATYNKVQTRLDNYKELGYSSSGVVIESAAEGFKAGDRVACAGVGYASHAERVIVPRNLAVKVPDGVSFEEAAFTTLAAIALQGVRQAEVRIGEYVAVIGLGMLGLITVQLLKAAGCRVIGLDVSAGKFELAEKLGCDDCVVSDFDAIKKVESFTRGLGTDAVLITAATTSNAPVELALQFARKKSKVIVVGAVGMNLPRSPFYEKELDFRTSCSYGPGRYDREYEENGHDYPVGYVRWTENRNMEAVLELIARGDLDVKPLITHKFAIDQSLTAYDVITGRVKEKYLGILIEYPHHGAERAESRRVVLRSEGPRENATHDPIVGFIGAGNHAQSYLIPPLQKHGARLKALVAARPVSAKSTGKKFGFGYCSTDPEEIFGDREIGAVFITSRHDSHAAYVVEALRRGKSVFVEKPLAIDEPEMNEIVATYNEAAGRGGSPWLMVGYNRRFSEPMRAVKEFFGGRKEPMVMSYRVNAGFLPKTSWYQSADQGGRIVGEVGHFVDAMQFLTDSAPVGIHAVSPLDAGRRYSSDNVTVNVSFADGSVGILSYLSNGAPGVDKEYLEVFGDGKTAIMESFKRVTLFADRTRRVRKFSGDKGHAEEMRVCLERLRTGSSAPISFQSVLATTQALFAINESLRTGDVIKLTDIAVEPAATATAAESARHPS